MTEEQEITFPSTFDSFLDFAEKVLQYNASGELIQASGGVQSNAIQVGLRGYRRIYDSTRNSPKHLEKFREIFTKCRSRLENDRDTYSFMDWFATQTIVITPGEKSRNLIRISLIFRKCCTIADALMSDEKTQEENQNNPANTYPETFMLHLFRLFSYCVSDADRANIVSPIIDELEQLLNLKKDEIPIITDGFGEMYSIVNEIAQEAGVSIPKGVGKITNQQFREAVSNIAKDSGTKKVIKEMFEGINLKNPDTLPATVGKILQKMTDTTKEIPEPIQRAMNATAD